MWAKRQNIVRCKRSSQTLVCFIKMPHVKCSAANFTLNLLLEFRSHTWILSIAKNPVVAPNESQPPEASYFRSHSYHHHSGQALSLQFEAWMCTAGCHETCVCHPPTSVSYRMLHFLQLFTSSIKDKSTILLCIDNLLCFSCFHQGSLMIRLYAPENL